MRSTDAPGRFVASFIASYRATEHGCIVEVINLREGNMVDVFLALFFLAGPTGAVVSWALWRRLRWSRSEVELLGVEVRSLEQQVAIQQALLLRTLNHDHATVARSVRESGDPHERFRRAAG